MDKYINIRFDNIDAGYFFHSVYMGPRRLIGERYDNYVVQFRSLASAKKAVLAYRKYCEGKGIVKPAIIYCDAHYADIGNHSAWPVTKLEDLTKNFFYLSY